MIKNLNKLRKIQKIRFFGGLIIVGIVLSVISGFVLHKTAVTTYITSEAVVSRVEEVYETDTQDGNQQLQYTVFIDYEVDGKKYTDVEFSTSSEEVKVGDKIEFRYNAEDPSQTATVGGDYIPYITLAFGVIAFAAGCVLLIKNIKQPAGEMNEYDKVKPSDYTQEQSDSVRNSVEPMQNYFFHFDSHIRQGYILENEYKEPVFEAKMLSMNPLKPFPFEFTNHYTGETRNVLIGKTVSYSIGSSAGFSYRVPINSSFTVDGKNNWDYLAENGYGFDCSFEGITPCFRVKHFGVENAYIKTEGTNALRNKDSLIGKIPVNGLFSVRCRKSDVDMIFMVCVSIARAIFYEND